MACTSPTISPRSGFAGTIDRFIGPGATSAELAVQLLPLPLAAFAAVRHLALTVPQSSIAQKVVAAVVSADVVGGILTNSTSAAKRWYHRPGQTARNHMSFVFLHLLHIAVISWMFRGGDLAFFVAISAALIVSATTVVAVPLYLQRPVALGLYATINVLDRCVVPPTTGLEWFLSLFFLKLIVAHLLKETAYQPRVEEDNKDE